MPVHKHVTSAIKTAAGAGKKAAKSSAAIVAELATEAAKATTIKPKKVARRGTAPIRKTAKKVIKDEGVRTVARAVETGAKGAASVPKTVESNLGEALGAIRTIVRIATPGGILKGRAEEINKAAEEARRKRRR